MASDPVVESTMIMMHYLAKQQLQEQNAHEYSYEELSSAAKEVVRNLWVEDRQGDPFLCDDISRDFYYELSLLGYCETFEYDFEDIVGLKVSWSLGYSQGDGVAFERTIYDVSKIARRLLSPRDYKLLTYRHKRGDLEGNSVLDYLNVAVIDTNGRYHHYNSFEVQIETQGIWEENLSSRQLNTIELLRDNIQSELVDLSHRLERLGYEMIEAQNSEDYVTEEILINWEDRRFTIKGKLRR